MEIKKVLKDEISDLFINKGAGYPVFESMMKYHLDGKSMDAWWASLSQEDLDQFQEADFFSDKRKTKKEKVFDQTLLIIAIYLHALEHGQENGVPESKFKEIFAAISWMCAIEVYRRANEQLGIEGFIITPQKKWTYIPECSFHFSPDHEMEFEGHQFTKEQKARENTFDDFKRALIK